MKTSTKQILRISHIISWVIFIGLCIKTGALLYSAFVSLVKNPAAAKNLYLGLDLSSLYEYSQQKYIAVITMIIFLSAMKALMFYQVIRIFLKINLEYPFSRPVSKLISQISTIAVIIGVLTVATNFYCKELVEQGVQLPELSDHLGGGGEFLLFAAVIFIISQLFKRGIEIQSENELTV